MSLNDIISQLFHMAPSMKLLWFTFILYLCAMMSLACDLQRTKFVNMKAKLYHIEDTTVKLPRQVYGNIKVIDGCRFRISNMTLIPSGQGVYWYAIPVVSPSEEEPSLYARVVQQALGSYNGQTVDFLLTPDYNFDDIAVMLLYSEGDRRSYAAFGVVGKVKTYFNDTTTADADLKLDPFDPYSGADTLRPFLPYIALVILMSITMCIS